MKNLLLFILFLFLESFLIMKAADKNKGDFSNLVVFLRFADEDEEVFENTFSYYEKMFNNSEVGANSVYNYFKEASYNQLFWSSVFYPKASDSGRIISYQAKNNRAYYRKYSSINPEGYADDVLGVNKLTREQNLVKELSDALADIVPPNEIIDADDNGIVDNLCIIVSGRSEIGNTHLLWPHRSTLYTKDGIIQGKKVNEYIMLFDDANGFGSTVTPLKINTGVLCHEMSHTLGTYDLYHENVRTDLNPVGVWDLMSDNMEVPQHMSAYTKYKYCKWIDEIPQISVPGKYVLNPVGGTSNENVAYKIQPTGSDEYFILEYRSKTNGTFDKNLPGSGLLIYRVNPYYTGNNAYDGSSKYDELYLFRPGGTTVTDGKIEEAFFSRESGRTAFGGDAEYKPFYTNGEEARFAIGNVSSCGETIEFELFPLASRIYLPQSKVSLPGNADKTTQVILEADIAWQILTIPDWLDVFPKQGKAGKSVITIVTKSENSTMVPRSTELKIEGVSASDVYAMLSVIQNSGMIQPPSEVKATLNGASVELVWKAPVSGVTVLHEDFESESSMAYWEIKKDSQNPAGWVRTESDKYTEVYNGSFAMRLNSDMSDMHQDEWFISPVFAKGAKLVFYSKSLAPQKNNSHNFYYVLVSSDGGESWKTVYDLKTQGTVVNKYEKITVDLIPYISDNMKVAFRAYDDNNGGLAYWWIIDGVEVYPEADSYVITGYEIFRNGVKIGTSTECIFTDNMPVEGENKYTVKALGDFGETGESEECIFNYSVSSINKITDSFASVYSSIQSQQLKIMNKDVHKIELLNAAGVPVKRILDVAKDGSFYIGDLTSGVYFVRLIFDNGEFEVTKIAKSN